MVVGKNSSMFDLAKGLPCGAKQMSKTKHTNPYFICTLHREIMNIKPHFNGKITMSGADFTPCGCGVGTKDESQLDLLTT